MHGFISIGLIILYANNYNADHFGKMSKHFSILVSFHVTTIQATAASSSYSFSHTFKSDLIPMLVGIDLYCDSQEILKGVCDMNEAVQCLFQLML